MEDIGLSFESLIVEVMKDGVSSIHKTQPTSVINHIGH